MADFNNDTGTDLEGVSKDAVLLMASQDEENSEFGDKLDDNERKLFELVKRGTFQEIKDFLAKTKSLLGLNKKDAKFRTVLQVAVCRGDLEIIEVILSSGCWDPVALKTAAALRLDDIVQLFIDNTSLDIRSATKQDPNEDYGAQDLNRHERSKEELRTMLRATIDVGDYKGTKKLITYLNTKFPDALKVICLCPECKTKALQETGKDTSVKKSKSKNVLQEAANRLEVCHILSSPEYILLTTKHPILKALEWANHLQRMAYWHPENKQELLHLAERSSKLAVDLLATCNDDEDTKLLFKVEKGVEKCTLKYRCFHDAIKYKEKTFIAHPTCQHLISELWLGPYYGGWRKWSLVQRILHVLLQILLMPFILMLSVFQVPFIKVFLKAPFHRFIYAATSYCLFLILLVTNQFGDRAKNWPTPSMDGFDIAIAIWVLAYICKIITDCINQRQISYIRMWWSTYDAIMMALFVAGAVTYVVGYGPTSKEVESWHLVLISKGFHGIAITMACLRTLQWLHLSRTIGPLVVSFSRMTGILKQFLVIIVIVLFSFSVGIHTVYKTFQTDLPREKKFDTFFGRYRKTVKLLFWAMFGKGDPRSATIPDEYHYFVRNTNITHEFKDSFSVKVGYTLWALFHVAVLIILLNMLIAVMTNHYQLIQDNADTEWKFACTELRLYYIEKNNKFPPPFNIFALIFRFFKYLYDVVKKCCTQKTLEDHLDASGSQNHRKRKKVVKGMIERYLQEREFVNITEQRQN